MSKKKQSGEAAQLLATACVLESLPSIKQKREYVEHAVRTILGIKDATLCLKACGDSAWVRPECDVCDMSNSNDVGQRRCPLSEDNRFYVLPVGSANPCPGVLVLAKSVGGVPSEVLDLLSNLLALLAVSIEKNREQRLFADTLRSIGDGIISCDREGRIMNLNTVAENLTGWTIVEAAGRPLTEVFRIVNAKTREPTDDLVAHALREGAVVELANQTILIAREGAEHQIADSCAPIKDSSGSVIGAVLTFRDMTEEYRREEQLRESEAKYRNLFNSNKDGIIRTDLDGKIMEVNKVFLEMTGYETLNELKHSYQELTPEKWRDFEAEIVRDQIIRRNYSDEYEKEYIHRNGTVFPINIKVWLIKDNDEAVGMWGIVRDITERKQAEEALRKAEQHLKSTIDGLSAHIAVLDDQGEIILTNKSYRDFAERNGVEPRAVSEGTNYLAVCDTVSGEHSEEAKPFAEGIREVLSGKCPSFELEYPCHSPDEKRWFIGRVTPFTGEGPRHVILAHENITKRKNAEELLRQTNTSLESAIQNANELAVKAEAANVAKSSFLAAMSHELRTPLHGMIGFTDLLADTPLNETQQKYLQTANASARTLLDLINDILDLSKIEAGRLELVPVRIDLNELIEDSVAVVRHQAEKKTLKLVINIAEAVPRFVTLDPIRFKQVLLNLLGNAVKFTDRGEIEFELGFTNIDGQRGKLLCSVHDMGIGISEEQRQQLFKSFSQVEKSTTRKFGGTGLGLAIANDLVEKMGGRIELASTPGKGSTFSFTIEVDYKRDSITGSKSVETEDTAKRADKNHEFLQSAVSVALVAEDNEVNMLLVKEQLLKLLPEVEIIEAANGEEAVRVAAERDDIDVILMDVQMPVMNGLEAARRIMEQRAEDDWETLHAASIIALTADIRAEMRDSCLAAGMDGFLAKPIILDQLKEKLAEVCGKRHNKDSRPEQVDSSASGSEPPVFDAKSAMSIVGDDIKIFNKIRDVFLERVPVQLRDLKELVENDDLPGARIVAHGIKGAAANVGGEQLRVVAFEVEKRCANGVQDGLDELLKDMEKEFEKLAIELKKFRM